ADHLDVLHRRQFVHGVEQGILEDRAQPARPGLALHGLPGDGAKRIRPDLEGYAFQLEQLLVLLDQRVPRLGEDADKRRLVELAKGGDDGQAADELWDQAELYQVLGLEFAQKLLGAAAALLALDVGAEADTGLFGACLDDLLKAGE